VLRESEPCRAGNRIDLRAALAYDAAGKRAHPAAGKRNRSPPPVIL